MNRAAQIRALYPGATVVERNKQTIRHRHATDPNKFIVDSIVGTPLFRGSGPYSQADEIDTAWQPSSGAWQYEMVLADYQVHARNVFNVGNLIEYRDPISDQWVVFDPQSLNWVDENTSRQQIAIKQAVAGVVTDDVLSFPAGWGAGRHFKYLCGPGRFEKIITIDSAANLPAPALAGTQIWLETEFSLSTSSGVAIYLDGILWSKANGVRVQTASRIEFRDAATGTQVFWWLDFPRAWDSAGNETVGQFECRRQGGPSNLFITVRIPREWVDAATFPIFLDPTIDTSVAASADDGGWYPATPSFWDNSSILHKLGGYSGDRSAYARWTGITMSGTIDVAYCEVWGHTDNPGVRPDIRGYAEDASNPGQITSYSDCVGRTRTTNYGSCTLQRWNSPGTWYLGPTKDNLSLVSPFQELVDSYTLSSTAVQVFLEYQLNSATWNEFRSYDYTGNAALSPKLHIEYTAAAGGGGGPLIRGSLIHSPLIHGRLLV